MIVYSSGENGIYLNGSEGTIKHYTDGVVDWEMPIEGNYSTWTKLWNVSSTSTWGTSYFNVFIVRAYEENDTLLLLDTYGYQAVWISLSNATLFLREDLLNGIYGTDLSATMFKYSAYVVNDGGIPTLKIFKFDSLIQSIDLTDVAGWTNTGKVYNVGFSSDGKYLAISQYSVQQTALFEGS